MRVLLVDFMCDVNVLDDQGVTEGLLQSWSDLGYFAYNNVREPLRLVGDWE